MSNVSEFPMRRSTSVEQEAGDWIARLVNGLTEDEEFELGSWLTRSSENHRVFMDLARLWDQMDALSRLSEICPEPTVVSKSAGSRYAWPIAAAVVLGLATILWLGESSTPQPLASVVADAGQPVHYDTAVGQQSTYELVDGTTIVLNTDTQVLVEYSEANRLLTLVRGEVHVKVAHDPTRPLSVAVGDKIVQAVGTEFNLEITNEQNIELVVTDGLVMVGVLDGSVEDRSRTEPLILTPSSTLVAAGQEVTFDPDGIDLDAIVAEDIESENVLVKLSWREGNLIFRGESLEEAVSEVGRYTAVEFVFLDEASKKVRVAGLFKAGDVEGLLAALRLHFNISYEWQGDDKIVLSKE